MSEGFPISRPKETRFHLQTHPQYHLFEQKRRVLVDVIQQKALQSILERKEPLEAAVKDKWNDVIMHDTKGAVSLIAGYEMVTPFFKKDPEIIGFSHILNDTFKAEHDVNSTPDFLLEKSNILVSYFRKYLVNKDLNLPPELKGAERFIGKAKSLARIWKMLYHSSRFLSSLSNNNQSDMDGNFRSLMETSLFTRDIVKKAGGEKTMVKGLDKDQKIDGAKGVMFYNLLKNAAKYSTSKVDVEFVGDSITITNDSSSPFKESSLEVPGKPGPNGNTGYGMFISKSIFGLLGGYDIKVNSGTEKDAGPPYSISLTILKKSPPASNAPLPHQPAQ